jgi:hypothetical protein
MNQYTRNFAFLALAGGAALTGWAHAACTPLNFVPTVITSPGEYCLTQDVVFPSGRGVAIEIQASGVTLDLQGFEMRGPHYGGVMTIAESVAVFAQNRSNITVRNGRISGFGTGVVITAFATVTYGHLIERLHIDGNASTGIALGVGGTVVRDNRITNLNGYLQDGVATKSVRGITAENFLWPMMGNRIVDNTITGMDGQPGAPSAGIDLQRANGTLIEGNYIAGKPNQFNATSFYGVKMAFCQPVTVVNNRFQNLYRGIEYGNQSTGKYSGNITDFVQIPYFGGTPAGNNY